jgi:hypothetical protein
MKKIYLILIPLENICLLTHENIFYRKKIRRWDKEDGIEEEGWERMEGEVRGSKRRAEGELIKNKIEFSS